MKYITFRNKHMPVHILISVQNHDTAFIPAAVMLYT
uniref:Uncharacterized protein n=1 Tax=Geladintestivirus 1 TaxID=3233133 RepID=A0AAU8MI57_9CAUD